VPHFDPADPPGASRRRVIVATPTEAP